MINLIVGSPGHGKTQFMISKILEIIEDNKKLSEKGEAERQIFSDIKDLMIPEIEPAPDDWRETPDGSIIIYDEVHFRKEYEYKGNQYSQDQMIKDLTIHRHTNKDFWLITQDAQRIEKGIHKLIDRMYYIKRPASKPDYTNVFEFDKWMSNPEPASNRNAKNPKYLDHYKFKFSDKYQKLYKSASDHSSIKFQLPKQLFVYGSIVLAILAFAGIALLNTNAFNTKRFEENAAKTTKTDTKTPASLSVATSTTLQNPDIECRKGVNVDKPECIEWFNNLSKNNSNVNQVEAVSYDPNKPYDFEYEPKVKPNDFPRMSGVMNLPTGKLIAVDQQGNYMKNISQQDCKKWLDGYRPFNYFAQKQESAERVTTSDLSNKNIETSSL